MKEIKAIIHPFVLERVLEALAARDDVPGLTVSQVVGWGRSRAVDAKQTVREGGHSLAKMTKIEIVVPNALADRVGEVIAGAARTGQPGDGKIFISDIENVIKIRTGERGESAL